jgi:hypothetical protein
MNAVSIIVIVIVTIIIYINSKLIKSLNSGGSDHHSRLAMWPWTNYLISLCPVVVWICNIPPKTYVWKALSSIQLCPRWGLIRWLDHENADLISILIHWWVIAEWSEWGGEHYLNEVVGGCALKRVSCPWFLLSLSASWTPWGEQLFSTTCSLPRRLTTARNTAK